MPLYKSKGEYLATVLEHLIEAIESYTKAFDGEKQGFHFDEYRERRDLDDGIRRAKEALNDDSIYERKHD